MRTRGRIYWLSMMTMSLLLLGFLISPAVLADGEVAEMNGSFEGYFITTKTDWEQLKSQLTLSPEVRALNPDFSKKALILAYWGQKPSAGYAIQIKGVEVQQEQIVVRISLDSPEKGSFTASVITFPSAAILVDQDRTSRLEKVVFKNQDGGVLQEVSVLGPEAYTVQVGDTLWKIAQTKGRLLPGEIMDFVHQVIFWNGLGKPDSLQPGQRLTVPGAVADANTFAQDEIWDLDRRLYAALREQVVEGIAGYALEEKSSLNSPLWMQEAAARSTSLRQANVSFDSEEIRVSESTIVAAYESIGPWIRDVHGRRVADIREIDGASVVNYLSLSPSGQHLAIGARGYQNLLLLWDAEIGRFTEVARYSDEIVSKIVWAPNSRYLTVELAGAWGRSRLENYTIDGGAVDWGLGEHWPTGYNLTEPRWMGLAEVLVFQVDSIGLEVSDQDLTGQWAYSLEDGRIYPAGANLNLL